MKVYGWTAHLRAVDRTRLDLPAHIVQCRCVIAAPSMAAIGRLLGKSPRTLFNLCETSNDREIAQALTSPGQFFAAALDGRRSTWIRVAPEAVS